MISAKAVQIIERIGLGASVMDHLHGPSQPGPMIYFPAVSVTFSNLDIDSAGAKQATTGEAEAKKDKDADTDKAESEKSQPKWKVVAWILAALAGIAAAAKHIKEIRDAFTP